MTVSYRLSGISTPMENESNICYLNIFKSNNKTLTTEFNQQISYSDMKKIAFLPLLALLALAACSDDNDNNRKIPEAPVVVVDAVADNVVYEAPAQVGSYTIEGPSENLYRFKYENGQEIVYTQTMESSQFKGANIATVRKIEGTAEDVVIPRVFTVENSDGSGVTEWQVVSVDLYVDAVSPNIKTITWPKGAYAYEKDSQYKAADPDWIRAQMAKCPNLEKMELEDGFPGFVSVQGAVYTKDFAELVSVPRGVKGTFTIAEGTTTVQTGAFDHCSLLDAITFPSSITSIEEYAVVYNDNLMVINMLPIQAPVTPAMAFGTAARNSILRIPEGSLDSYIVEKPQLEEPVAPAEPDMEESDDVWNEYYDKLAIYEEELAAYNEAMSAYTNVEGFVNFTNIQQTKF